MGFALAHILKSSLGVSPHEVLMKRLSLNFVTLLPSSHVIFYIKLFNERDSTFQVKSEVKPKT